MLGYELSDLDDMIDGIQIALNTVGNDTQAYNKIWKAKDFLQGLWAEGYFD